GVRIFRIRVWSGGSANPSPPGSLSAETPASPTRLEKSLLNDFTSLSTAFASSCPLTSHARMPKGNGSLLTGSRSRVSPSCGTGSSPSRFSGNSVFSESGIFERSKPCFCLRARYFRPIHPAIRERRVVMPRCYRTLRHAKQHALLHGLPPGFDGLGRRHVDTLPRPGHRDRHSDGLGLRPHTVDGVTPTVQRELERAPVHRDQQPTTNIRVGGHALFRRHVHIGPRGAVGTDLHQRRVERAVLRSDLGIAAEVTGVAAVEQPVLRTGDHPG